MHVFCPKCEREIDVKDINVGTDIAACAQCNEVFPLSSLVQLSTAAPPDLDNPPRGVRYEPEFNGFTIRSTTRHPMAFFLVPFMCVWSGFSLGGIYGTQIVKGEFNWAMSLFGIPFILGTLLFGSIALMSVAGKVVLRILDNEGSIFTGLGPIGRRQSFDWTEVTAVRKEKWANSNDGPAGERIVLDGPRVKFGGILTEQRRDFLVDVLQHKLLARTPHSSASRIIG